MRDVGVWRRHRSSRKAKRALVKKLISDCFFFPDRCHRSRSYMQSWRVRDCSLSFCRKEKETRFEKTKKDVVVCRSMLFLDDDFRIEQQTKKRLTQILLTMTKKYSLPPFLFEPSSGGFVVDDDGGGYVDIGEEDDWSVAADGVEDGGRGKQQQHRKGLFFFFFFRFVSSDLVLLFFPLTHALSLSLSRSPLPSPQFAKKKKTLSRRRTSWKKAEEEGFLVVGLRGGPAAPPRGAASAHRKDVLVGRRGVEEEGNRRRWSRGGD